MAGPSPRLSAWITQLRRNHAESQSWRSVGDTSCVRFDRPGIRTLTSRTDSNVSATELNRYDSMVSSRKKLKQNFSSLNRSSLFCRFLFVSAPVSSSLFHVTSQRQKRVTTTRQSVLQEMKILSFNQLNLDSKSI